MWKAKMVGVRSVPECGCFSHNGFLTERGFAELAQQVSLEGLTPLSDCVRVDKSVSVSALVEVEVSDLMIDEQYRRFLNGS